MIQPSLRAPLAILSKSSNGATYQSRGSFAMHHIKPTYAARNIDFDEPLHNYSGGDNSITSTALKTGLYYDQDASKVVERGAYYNCETFAHGSNAGFSVHNRGPAQITVAAYSQTIFADGSRSAAVAGTPVNITNGATAQVPFASNVSLSGCVGIACGVNLFYTSGNAGTELSMIS